MSTIQSDRSLTDSLERAYIDAELQDQQTFAAYSAVKHFLTRVGSTIRSLPRYLLKLRQARTDSEVSAGSYW